MFAWSNLGFVEGSVKSDFTLGGRNWLLLLASVFDDHLDQFENQRDEHFPTLRAHRRPRGLNRSLSLGALRLDRTEDAFEIAATRLAIQALSIEIFAHRREADAGLGGRELCNQAPEQPESLRENLQRGSLADIGNQFEQARYAYFAIKFAFARHKTLFQTRDYKTTRGRSASLNKSQLVIDERRNNL